MIEQFQAHPIDAVGAMAAYPLVQLYDDSVSIGQWLRFVRRYSRRKSGSSGLIVLRDRRSIVHALFSYRVDSDLRIRQRLCISNLIVGDIAGSGIHWAIRASTTRIADSLGCQRVVIEQPFNVHTGAIARCPTAEALCAAMPSLSSERRH